MEKITLFAPAKINLYLDVINKRSDGFHDIESVMLAIDLGDEIEVIKNCGNTQKISISCSESALPSDENNIAYKAAKAIFDYANFSDYDIEINIKKHIPFCAGLAGGSTDAAATIIAINKLFGFNYDEKTLCNIGEKVGSDVPFCIVGGLAKTFGKGEIIESISCNLDSIFVIAKSNDKISTPEAYGKIDALYSFPKESKISDFCNALFENDIEKISDLAYNVFESVTECENVEKIKKSMANFGAKFALMSGSGPAVFGVFDDIQKAKAALEHFNQNDIFATLAKAYKK